ncbi:dihydroorotase [Candidatus Kaiserbacteria bacterium]|nr:dihydroorotase [Candidatus Kaiserbacteria bacterium]
MTDTITIKKSFDAHVHFRQGAMLKAVVPLTAAKWSRAIVMPNTEPPIETVETAVTYKKEIFAAVPKGNPFEPLMTLYLTKNLSPAEIEKGMADPPAGGCKIHAVKSYPYGATTNSQWGYRSILEAKDVLKKMEELGMPLLLHGEVHVNKSGEEVDPYEGEQLFIQDVLPRLLDKFPKLKISLEHLSSKIAAEFIERNGKAGQLVATITPHHLLYSREEAAPKPLLRCKPLIKTRADRERIRALVQRGLPFVFAGTDSAPHPESKKFSSPGAYGVFSAPTALELYAQVFDELAALDKLENFLSVNGPRFYGLTGCEETITLEKKDWQIEEPVVTEEGVRVWLLGDRQHGVGNETLRWQIPSA